ncbi:hypothetical protein Sjap_008119 [Stephania japonica]|uniref:Integrase catalytic domain-containing protein n=1 Tax=Stephania japonica TaxID=461633 RepID=A0AAP0JPQ1_9MAGN
MILQDIESSQVLVVGRLVARLYILDISSFTKEVIQSFTCILDENLNKLVHCNQASTDFSWHYRLGHPSIAVTNHLQSLLTSSRLQSHVDPCDVCHMSKQCRLSFPLSSIKSQFPFQLLHMDIWGPYRQVSLHGSHYVLTIVDDFTRFTWTYLLQCKSSTCSTIEIFLLFAKNQFNSSVKAIRTDNGTEFVNKSCVSLFAKFGILHQRSAPYSPQQNGLVERKHRHLLQVTRALVFQSGLSKSFWGDAVLTATYIINRLSSLLNWNSPFQMLFNKHPDYSFMKSFGAFVMLPTLCPTKINLNPEPLNPFSLVTVLVKKVTNYIIFLLRQYLFLEMLFSMKQFFLLNILLLLIILYFRFLLLKRMILSVLLLLLLWLILLCLSLIILL